VDALDPLSKPGDSTGCDVVAATQVISCDLGLEIDRMDLMAQLGQPQSRFALPGDAQAH
jgi:hypothetical protein